MDAFAVIIAAATARSGNWQSGSGCMSVPGPPDVIAADRAAAIFAEFASAGDLALRFPADGCYARAHVMVRRLLDQGLFPLKLWAFAASATDLLRTEAP